MKKTKQIPFVLTLACAVTCLAIEAPGHKVFSSPEDAVKALTKAAEARDKAALHEIFGSDADHLLTGDDVQDATNFKSFTAAVSEKCVPVHEGENKLTLEIGTDAWPFPIPLVTKDGKWFFDTDAGMEEIVNRHIGSDELHAIGVCRAYVVAQREYASANHDGIKGYALKFKSTPGKEDGLYWANSANGRPAPLQALVEEAHAEGYGKKQQREGEQPFHGYRFKILTRQGRAAQGGKEDYMVDGNMIGGFALVAYPARWGQSGVMTFLVNQEGKVYQRNLGNKTTEIVTAMAEYNPTGKWTPVTEAGVIDGGR